MKLNYRWWLQCVSYIGCIYFFIQIWDKSQALLAGNDGDWISLILYLALFFFFLFWMAVTSYLKQKANGTLKNSIPIFERLIVRFNLMALAAKKE